MTLLSRPQYTCPQLTLLVVDCPKVTQDCRSDVPQGTPRAHQPTGVSPTTLRPDGKE